MDTFNHAMSEANFQNKTIVLGVCGSIAAYKACEVASQLTQAGANVHVLMTSEAAHMVGPATFASLTKNPVVVNMWEPSAALKCGHMDFADAAHAMLIAPATAHTIGCLAGGLAPDALTSCYLALATRAPIYIAPAMNGHMLAHPAVQKNITTLKTLPHHTIIEPETGMLACGYQGKGRLASPTHIVQEVAKGL